MNEHHSTGTHPGILKEREVVRRIRELRVNRGLVLEDLSKRTGFSKSYLSKVENSDKAPPVSTLSKIARALGVSMSAIFGEDEAPLVPYNITRAADRISNTMEGASYGYSHESLAQGYRGRKMDPYYVEIPPNADQPLFQHPGDEMFFVLEGNIRVVYGDIEFVLDAGDCCYFDANVPHHAYAIGERTARALMILCAPDD